MEPNPLLSNMRSNEKKVMSRRILNSYLSSVISISLVLLLVGLASLLLVSAGSVSEYFKRNLKVSVVMKASVGEGQAMKVLHRISDMNCVENTVYISKAQGTREMEELLGRDFLSVFEGSPIPASIDVTLRSEYVEPDSLALFKSELQKFSEVDDVVYRESLIEALTSNLAKISMVLGTLIVLLLFISFVLINNTVRLGVYAKRFTIHTMKLVGATKGFIRAPFLWQAVFQGLFSAIIAISLLLAGLFILKTEFSQLFGVLSREQLGIVIGTVVLSGVLICLVSTYFIVGRLVSLPKNELYY